MGRMLESGLQDDKFLQAGGEKVIGGGLRCGSVVAGCGIRVSELLCEICCRVEQHGAAFLLFESCQKACDEIACFEPETSAGIIERDIQAALHAVAHEGH